ncbi:hypothetical protein MRB53_014322 [Persea americana]|uniref:Uncharacterized protein n=1 Tax=Persea americana TaxID=3435 RepID=A0ACC2KAP6_PERAE|nr:hypothetical protein MRB53_014322 [Persea americana]
MATLTSVITGSLKAQGLRAGCPPLSFNLRQEGHSVSFISHPFNASVSGRRALKRATGTSVTTSGRRTLVVCRGGGREADVGLCFGRMSSHVPTAPETLQLYKSTGISKMMLCQTDDKIIPLLQLLCKDKNASSQLQVVLCIDFKDLSTLAYKENAKLWFDNYILPFQNVISHVVVGDVIGYDAFSLSVFQQATDNIRGLLPPATNIKLSFLANVRFLLGDAYYADTLPSTASLTEVSSNLLNYLATLYPPPASIPLFLQIMPFFISANPNRVQPIPLCNYLLQQNAPSYMSDGQYSYLQVYDAMLDGICCALHGGRFGSVENYVVSGWPTAGRPAAGDGIDPSIENAKTYNGNLAGHGVTPRGNIPSTNFIYSLVDEDKLGTPVEEFKHFGSFIPWKIMTFP